MQTLLNILHRRELVGSCWPSTRRYIGGCLSALAHR